MPAIERWSVMRRRGMTVTISITLISLSAFAFCVIAAERDRTRERVPLTAYVALLAGYGTCVGIGSSLLIYFFSLSVLSAVVIGLPLGFPVLLACAKLAQA